MDETRINENEVQILVEGAPIPFEILRVSGEWKVNPAHTIAGRKAYIRSKNED